MSEGVSTEGTTDWQSVYGEHSPAIFAFLLNRTGHRQDAEDLLQETFVRAMNAGDALREEGRMKAYLFSIAHNVMVNWYRKKSPEAMPSMPDGSDPFEQVADGDRISPDDEVQWRDLHGRVHRILDTMSERYSLAFRFGVLEGRAYSEIARSTGWSASQVKINIHRARRQMIEALREQGFLE